MATITRSSDRERESMRRSALSSQGPTAEQQANSYDRNNPLSVLGDPQDPTNVSFPFLRRIRRDHMVAMGLHFIAMPIVKAPWYYEADDARVAAFADNLIRPIYGRLILSLLRMLSFGYSPAVKNHFVASPAWTYLPRLGADPERVWPEGPVGAMLYKPVTPLKPENALPMWDSSGSFKGITYDASYGGVGHFVINGQRKPDVDLLHSVWAVHDQDTEDGCQPPGEMVLTTQGYVPIEQLDPEKHKLVSYNPSQSKIHRGVGSSPKHRGYGFEVFTRPHQGDMLTIAVGDKQMRATPNHKLTVRWAEHAKDQHAVYLMRRGDDWRIGSTRVITEKTKQSSSGVRNRMQREGADEAWILGVYNEKRHALFYEALWSSQFGVPDMCFKAGPAATGSSCLRQEDVDLFWKTVKTQEPAEGLLADRGLYPSLPLFERAQEGYAPRQAGRVQWALNAANLIPGSMELPTDPGHGQIAEWGGFTVKHADYDGVVYSLQVDPYKHYVSGGVITRNSPFGFPRIAHCAPIFHMYRYIWTLMGRAFENNADPGPVVRYPREDMNALDATGKEVSNVQVALKVGRRRRSGSTVALPSDQYTDFQDKPTGKYKWDIEYPESKTNFSELQNFLGFLESAKLRSLWLQEQGLIEGSGGQCVTADTPVDCPRDHRRYPAGVPISEIHPGQLIWAFNQRAEKFELWPVKEAWKTKYGAILKLTLDDGSVIRATPDHLVLKRDNTWSEMKDLKPGDSLMHLLRDFEPLVKTDPNAKGKPNEVEYVLTAKALWGEDRTGRVTHHVDERHSNNGPDNLADLTPNEHAALHRRGPLPQHVRDRISETNKATWAAMTDEERAEKRKNSKAAGARGLETMASWSEKRRVDMKRHTHPAFECSTDCGYCSGEWAISPGKRGASKGQHDPEAQRKLFEDGRLHGSKRWEGMTAEERKHLWHHERDRACLGECFICAREHMLATNHRVVSIEPDGSEDVWDLSVEGPEWVHSFVSLGAVLHNSNRNVASEFGSQRDASQAVLMQQLDDVIDETFIKPALAMNMPWYEGKLVKKTIGFGSDDEDLVRQVLQLSGQDDFATFGIDVRKLAEARGFPMLDYAEQQKMREEAAKRAEAAPTPEVKPTQGRRALVTQTGFDREKDQAVMSYVQIEEPIYLSLDDDFVSSLPKTDTFADRRLLSITREIRNSSSGFLTWAYGDFARYLGKQKTLDLSELLEEIEKESLSQGIELDDGDKIRKAVDKLMSGWRPQAQRITDFRKKFRDSLSKAYDRTAGLQLGKIGSKSKSSSIDKVAADWLDTRGAELVADILETTRTQIASVLADGVREGKKPTQIAADIRQHFDTFPESRAATIARTEMSTAYNFATVTTGLAAGVTRAQLLDGNDDEPCKTRNGKIVKLADALKEKLAHPHCTLTVRLLPGVTDRFEIRREALSGIHARYDSDTQTVLLSPEISPVDESAYLIALGDKLSVVTQEEPVAA